MNKNQHSRDPRTDRPPAAREAERLAQELTRNRELLRAVVRQLPDQELAVVWSVARDELSFRRE
jgi:hypothetical protein